MPTHVPPAPTAVAIVAITPPLPPVVLIVDGDPSARVAHAIAFHRHGCMPVLAEDVNEAVTCLSRPWLAIDVVLLSLALPGLRAETLLTIIKNTPRFAGIRTVAHWAAGDRDEFGHGRLVDLAGYGCGAYVEDAGDWAAVMGACFPS